MENVFREIGAQVSATVDQTTTFRPKRSAFIFITSESETNQATLADLRKISAVDEAYLARGAYDIVAKVSGDSFDQIRDDVLRRIRNINNVKSTLTLTVV